MPTLIQGEIPSRAHDGARVLWRHWYSTNAPREGWVREVAPNGTLVRIAGTNDPEDKGQWYISKKLRVVSVLEQGTH